MLTLGRKQGQRIRITTPGGEVIWIRMGRITHYMGALSARLSFEAPPLVVIEREEVIRRKEREEVANG